MHNISGDREHAMWNITNRTIPVALLANYRKVSIINFQGAGSQDITVMPIAYKGAAQTMELSSSAM
jgi:dsDNA-specific endonuclease/ATPase MutS2